MRALRANGPRLLPAAAVLSPRSFEAVAGLDSDGDVKTNGAEKADLLNPMPEGFEEYDWKNGWPLVGERKVVIFGRGVRGPE